MEKDMDKIAIIDLGSNSTRLVLVDILKGGYFQVVDDIKETVRLAQDMEIELFTACQNCADYQDSQDVQTAVRRK